MRKKPELLGELIVTPESKSLVHLYYLTERAGKLGRSVRDEIAEARIGVIGGGVMGAGIAASFLAKGYPVTLVELVEEARHRAEKHIHAYIMKRRGRSEAEKSRLLEQLIHYW